MHSGFFTQEREYAFVPHLTIGQGLSDAEHADVLGRLRMKDFITNNQLTVSTYYIN